MAIVVEGKSKQTLLERERTDISGEVNKRRMEVDRGVEKEKS